MKHTEGPWFIKDYSSKTDIHTEINGESVMVACAYQLNGYPKDEDNNTIPCEQALANAKLIAAAPELLEALIRINNLISIDSINNDLCHEVQAAIKKATE